MNYLIKTVSFMIILISMSMFSSTSVAADKKITLSLKDFVEQATQNNLTFESILIDELPLKHRRDLLLPDSDIIMDIKYQHHFYLDQDRDNPQASIALSKLFPDMGTQVSLSYNKSTSTLTTTDDSSLQLLISQPIVKNAFGNSSRLQSDIIGIENDITRYQIIEAYEDYLASLTVTYYNWFRAYENLKSGKISYRENQKLMENILDRQKQKIALPIDVNKMKLLLAGKKENVILLQETYDTYSNLIFNAIRHTGKPSYKPGKLSLSTIKTNFNRAYNNFKDNSRTYKMLHLLEKQGTLEVKKVADDLLPSTNLLLGYQMEGQNWSVDNSERSYFAGISIKWPFGNNVNKAKKQIAQIEYKKTILSNQNKYEDLHTNLKNLYLQIQRENKLTELATRKIQLAEAIRKDEAENYSFGKVSLNDYIDAVNRVDELRFSHTEHIVELNKLNIEWLRLSDQLVNKNILKETITEH